MLVALMLSPALAAWPDPPASGWTAVQQHPTIACTRDAAGLGWCYAEQDATVPYARVVAAIRDLDHYPATFEHVDAVRRLDADTAWIHVDYPSPLSDRDYIAGFAVSGAALIPGMDPQRALASFHLRFHAVENPAAPPGADGTVRLTRAAGAYDVWDLGGGQTRLRYTWESDLGGDVPAWINDRARLLHGAEVLNGLYGVAGR